MVKLLQNQVRLFVSSSCIFANIYSCSIDRQVHRRKPGCGTVGKVATFETKDPRFESSLMQILITFNCVSCIEKTKIKNKDARNGQIFKQHPPISKTICENHFFCKSSYLVHKSFTYLVPMFITVLCRQHIYSLNLHLLPFMPTVSYPKPTATKLYIAFC